MRRPITATTIIALALGTAAVVAPSATADDYGLGGKDGDGIIARGDQMASNLPAGSCTVANDHQVGSQVGFTWGAIEPRVQFRDKTAWGLEVSFDNSSGRTFSDWIVTGTNTNAGEFLELGEVPALEAGVPFDANDPKRNGDFKPTHTADELIKVQRSSNRAPLTATVIGKLTDEKVAAFAKATADNPIRYMWKSHYLKENYKNFSTQIYNQTYAEATVNPWPSENNECNPITTSWDKVENHVITPGEETKVGTINVPALADGSGDDSLSRMVVEAYGVDGKVIGTSDATAGDKHRIRIADNGDVFFTWPDYRDPKNGIADDRTVNFRTIALPRSVEQLQTATEHNTELISGVPAGFTSESSNILPRYNTPNEIDKHTISLDDTVLHDPQYETPTRTLISGIIDGAPSDTHKEIVLTQTGDLIADMVEREDAPNNKIKVELDDEYVYSGWDAEFVDPDNGNYDVRVTAPANPAPGTFARPVVKVSYTNGSEDILPILVIVDPNHTQQTDLAYTKVPATTPGETRTIDARLDRVIGKGDVITPKSYALNTDDLPDGWTAHVNQDTGEVTVTPSESAPNGEQFTGTVTATYPDGTTDTAEVNVTAISAIRSANYDAVTLSPGTPVELAPIVADKDVTGGDGPAPSRYTFADGATTIEQDGVTFTINPDTGVITADGNATVPNGTHVKVPVHLHYPSNPTQTTNAEVISVVAPTRPVPFEVETVFDNTIPSGEARVTREGTQGVEAIQPDGSWKVTSQPVNAQVTVGTKPSIATATQTWTLPVPFDTERRANPELAPGETRTIQEGTPGERSLTVNVTAQGETAEIAPETVTREPVTEIIEYGPDNNARETVTTRTLPFETKIIYDPELPEGTSQTKQEGKDGTVTTTATQRVIDGKPEGDPVITEEVTEPVEMIVRVGAKKVSTNVTSEITQSVTPETRVIYDPELPAGEVTEENPGKAGEKTITVTRTVTGGTADEPVVTEKITTQPEDRVVRIGTKAAGEGTLNWDVPLPYPTEFKENTELAPGETREVQPGKDGKATFTATFGVDGDTPVATEQKDRTEPTPRIIEYGPAGEATQVVDIVERTVPFKTKVTRDPSLPKGTQVIDQGEFGSERVTITRTVASDGTVSDPQETTERIAAPKDAVIRIGTGEVDPVNTDVTIPFGTRIVFDPSFEPGQEVEDVAGKNGTSRVTFQDGTASVEVVTQPVERVVRVGSKPGVNSWTERVPFDIEVRENDQRPAGEYEIIRKGVAGERVHADGEVADVKEPVDMIVEVGTKQPEQPEPQPEPEQPEQPEPQGPVVTDVEVPFGTKIVYDPSLEAGQEIEDVAGSTGLIQVTVEDGTSTTDEVRTVVDRVLRVGTKPAQATWTEHTPFGVEIRENTALAQGEHKVIQEGMPGVIEHVEGAPTVITEAVPMIIEIGAKEPEAPATEPTTEPDTPEPSETPGEPEPSGEPKPSDEPGKPGKPNDPATQPDAPSGSSEKLQRCVSNATASNSPFVWLLPIALLGGIGYGVGEVFGPQIAKTQAQLQAQFNDEVGNNTSGLGSSIHEPAWVRQARAQADAVTKQFGAAGENLQPVGQAAGVVLAIAALATLTYQACQPDGFGAWFGPDGKESSDEGSSKN